MMPSVFLSSGQNPMPSTGSLMWRSQGLRFAFDQRRAAVSRFDTEDHFGGFGTSGSQQASQTDDLAGAHFEIKRCYRSFLP